MKITRSLAATARVAAGSAALLAAPGASAQLVVRRRAIYIAPQERSSPLSLGVSNEVTPELELSWFFTPNVTVELIVDVKKVWIETDVKTAGGAFVSNLKIDPLLFGIGIGYKF
jgi:outer membrane protein W